MTTPNNNGSSNPFGEFPNSGDQNNSYVSGNAQNNGYGAFPESEDFNASNGYGAFPQSNDYGSNPNGMQGNFPGAGRRFLSYIVDTIIYYIIAAISVAVIAMDTIKTYFDEVLDAAEAQNNGIQVETPVLDYGPILLATLVAVILWLIYRAVMESQMGATLGRMATGTRVQDINTGENPSFVAALIRASWFIISSVANVIPFIGVLASIAIYIAVGVTISRSNTGQSFTDKWAKTQVVYK